MKNSKSLALLVEEILDGHTEAFEELYRQTCRAVFFHARKILKNEQDVEDAVSEAYLRAYENLSRLQEPEAVQAWLCRIVANIALNMLRDDRSRDAPSFDDEEFFLEPVAPESETPELVLDQKGTEELIAAMIDALPEVQRTAVMLYYYDEMSVAQIASVMDCSEGTVKSRLNYARRHLEEAVLAEEKCGVRLYSVSPALLLASIRRLISAEALSPASYWSVARTLADGCGYALSEGGKAAAAQGAKELAAKSAVDAAKTSAVKGAAKTVGAGSVKSTHAAAGTVAARGTAVAAAAVKTGIGTKAVAIAVAAVITVGGTATGVVVHNHNVSAALETPSAIVETVAQEPAMETPLPDGLLPPMDSATPIREEEQKTPGNYAEAYREVLAGYPSHMEYGYDNNTYVLYDMDWDGTPELLIRHDAQNDPASSMLAIYRFDGESDTSTLLFDDLIGRRDNWSLAPYSEGVLVHYGHMGWEEGIAYLLNDGRVSAQEIFERDAREVDYLDLTAFSMLSVSDLSGLNWLRNPGNANAWIIDEYLSEEEQAAGQQTDEVQPSAPEPVDVYQIYREVVRALTDIDASDYYREDNYCVFYDLDGDGTEEMLMHYFSSKRSECYHRLAVYAIRNGQAVCLYDWEFICINGTGWFSLCNWDGVNYLAAIASDADSPSRDERVDLLDLSSLTKEHYISARAYPDLETFTIMSYEGTVDGVERSWDEYNEKIFSAVSFNPADYTVILISDFIK